VCGLSICAVLALVVVAVGQNAQPAPPPNPPPNPQEIRIGFPDALFKDVPKPLINAAVGPFQRMIQKQIGMSGTMKICQDYVELADDLKAGKVDIGVFHGFEFAWVKNNPAFLPLVITNPSCGKVQACLIVHANNKAKSPQQLKGACVGIPKGTKAHCTMFLKHLQENTDIAEGDCCPMPSKTDGLTPHEVLSDVVTGKCEAALVDIAHFETYRRSWPGLGEQLKVLAESELLPPAVIVCRKGALSDKQIQRVREGLLACHKTPSGRAFTMFWQLEGFKDVCPAYLQLLDRSLKEYPEPGATPQARAPMSPMVPMPSMNQK
jgi:ABC-type phosphate/phosphonate transport system substrate-binding protein